MIPETRRPVPPLIAGLYATLLALGFLLLFTNLDGRLLWGDEAETAVLAKNVVMYGLPVTVDGRNHVTLYGSDLDGNADHVWIFSPWLQQYLAAGAFALFGPTTWAARAPSALAGWLCLGLLGYTAYRIYRNHWIALAAVLLLETSEVFLLHARQCRYHALTVLGEILLILAMHQLLRRDRKGPAVLAFALLLQFYSNYIIAVANLPAVIALAAALYARDKRAALPAVTGLAAFATAAVPWLVYARPWQHLGVLTDDPLWDKISFYLRDFHFHFFPWAFLLLPAWGLAAARWAARPRGERSRGAQGSRGGIEAPETVGSSLERYLVLLMPLYLAVLVLPPAKFARYLCPLLPVVCVLGSAWAFRYIRWRAVAVALILVQCTSNGIAVVTGLPFKGGYAFRWPFPEYVRGITRPYQDRFADVVAFFERESRPGQTVLVGDPEFPLMFYTHLAIIDARFTGGELPEPLPDWILSESASGMLASRIDLPESVSGSYDALLVPVHDSPRGGSTPEPEAYQYEPAGTRTHLIVYRRRDG